MKANTNQAIAVIVALLAATTAQGATLTGSVRTADGERVAARVSMDKLNTVHFGDTKRPTETLVVPDRFLYQPARTATEADSSCEFV